MSSLVQRSAVLGMARIAQQALGFLSPIFLVRLLSVEQYGEYRDFLLYGSLLVTIVQFSINNSLSYFVPKYPERERLYFVQANLFTLCSSSIAILLVVLFGDYFPSEVAQSHLYALALYVFLVANLDPWEIYWIATRRTTNVFFYATSRLSMRVLVVVGSAYLTRSVETIIWVLVMFEAARLLVMGVYAGSRGLLFTRIDTGEMKAQFDFFAPIGLFGLIFTLNAYVGQFFVSVVLGAAALAVYSIGTYLYPIIYVIRDSIGGVIMPEIVSRQDQPPREALGLWQRATLVYCSVMLPLAVLLGYYADVFVETLFTSAYAEAIPIFQIFVLLLVRECFDMAMPLRVVNRTRIFVVGAVLVLIVNLGLMLALFDVLGILAPAVAMIVSRVALGVFLGIFVMRYCGFSLANLLPWAEMAIVAMLALLAAPILYAGEFLDLGPVLRSVVFGGLYAAFYVMLLSRFGFPEIKEFLGRTLALVRPS